MFISDHTIIHRSTGSYKKAISKIANGPKEKLFTYSNNRKPGTVIGLMILIQSGKSIMMSSLHSKKNQDFTLSF